MEQERTLYEFLLVFARRKKLIASLVILFGGRGRLILSSEHEAK
jgi:hypothetical protein